MIPPPGNGANRFIRLPEAEDVSPGVSNGRPTRQS
jgi:hypothetical protein